MGVKSKMSNVQPIWEEEVKKKADVIKVDFRTGEKTDNPDIKYRKDGKPKQTKSNAKKNRDNVYPFKEEDIPKMVEYFQEQIDKAIADKSKEKELIARRNLAGYIMGINIGLRASDFVSFKWNDIYDKDFNFLSGKKITPKKTRKKKKHILLKYNDAFKRAIEEYRLHCKNIKMDDYIFKSREGEHIVVRTWYNIIKKAATEVGITYNIGSHSLRKTFARVRYDHSTQKDKTLIELMKIFNHSSPTVTLDYICIGEKELEQLYNDVNLGYEEIDEEE